MPKAKSQPLDPALIAKATAQATALKGTLTEIGNTVARSTKGAKALNKNGRPLAKVARNAATTYPEVLAGVFDKDDYDIKLNYDEQTEPLLSFINDTVDTFVKICFGNSADLEYLKRKIYNALVNASADDDQYSFYANQLAKEYAGQGKRSDNGDKGAENTPKA